MKIGVIGIGAIGGTIARKLASEGHQVRVANSRGVDAVRQFATEIGAEAADVQGAVDGADAVVISIPFPAIQQLPKGLFDNLPGNVPVIDTGNYYPGMRDPQIAEIDGGKIETLWVSEQLGRSLVKAFNNIMARSLAERGKLKGEENRIALSVFGDDPTQKITAIGLIEQMGFTALDAGNLLESWRAQPGSPTYCCDYGVDELKAGLAAAVPDKLAERRDDFLASRGEYIGENPSHDDLVNLLRRINNP